MTAELRVRVLALLKRLLPVGQYPGWCPDCFEDTPKHKPDCELAAVIAELGREG
jgi:hypothetical protein